MGRLSDRAVKAAGEGRHSDGDGLYLVVASSGRRKWVYRYQANGARRDMGLGSYPDVGLADARIAAGDARKLIAQGEDPVEARRAARKEGAAGPDFRRDGRPRDRRRAGEVHERQGSLSMGAPPRIGLLGSAASEAGQRDHDFGRGRGSQGSVWREKPEVARKLYPAIRRVLRIRPHSSAGQSRPIDAGQPRRLEWREGDGLPEPPRKLSREAIRPLHYSELLLAVLRPDLKTAHAKRFLPARLKWSFSPTSGRPHC